LSRAAGATSDDQDAVCSQDATVVALAVLCLYHALTACCTRMLTALNAEKANPHIFCHIWQQLLVASLSLTLVQITFSVIKRLRLVYVAPCAAMLWSVTAWPGVSS
jgi:hypothetical protein